MGSEDFVKLNEYNFVKLSDVVSDINAEVENLPPARSVFDEVNNLSQSVEINKDNLVEIQDLDETKVETGFLGFLKNLWQKIFSSKTTMPENAVVNPTDKCIEGDENVSEEELKWNDYNILSKEDPKYTVNGEIDQDFSQGNVADCMLLAGLYSLSRSDAGRAIIKDAISINYDENGNTKSYDVYFKGLDKTYNIPVEEYMEAERLRLQYQRGDLDYYLSAGDDDVLLMELAYQKAFDDICEAKRSSGLFSKTDALTSVEYEQFLYAFVGGEDVNTDYWIREKYKEEQVEKYKPEIMEIFETQQEFKLEDVYISDVKIGAMSINSMEFNWEDTYVIEQKPSESENGGIAIINKETGEKLVIDAEYLAECFANDLTIEQEKQVGSDMYDLAIESDFVTFGNASHEPIDVVDIDGKTWTIFQQHAYGVKEITQEHIILVNPHNSLEEIKISKDEYLKHYNNVTGFELFSANFND